MAPSASDADRTPAIRTFQLDGRAIGCLSSAVNLFCGDVNLLRQRQLERARPPARGDTFKRYLTSITIQTTATTTSARSRMTARAES